MQYECIKYKSTKQYKKYFLVPLNSSALIKKHICPDVGQVYTTYMKITVAKHLWGNMTKVTFICTFDHFRWSFCTNYHYTFFYLVMKHETVCFFGMLLTHLFPISALHELEGIFNWNVQYRWDLYFLITMILWGGDRFIPVTSVKMITHTE